MAQRELGLTEKKIKAQPPESFEWDWSHDLLSGIFELDQQAVHYTAAIPRRKKPPKPKVVRFPHPRSAADRIKKREAREAHAFIESKIVYTDEPYGGPKNGQPKRKVADDLTPAQIAQLSKRTAHLRRELPAPTSSA